MPIQEGLFYSLTIHFIPHYDEIHAQRHNLLFLLLRMRLRNIRPPEKEVLSRVSDNPVARLLVKWRICTGKALQHRKHSAHMAEVVVNACTNRLP